MPLPPLLLLHLFFLWGSQRELAVLEGSVDLEGLAVCSCWGFVKEPAVLGGSSERSTGCSCWVADGGRGWSPHSGGWPGAASCWEGKPSKDRFVLTVSLSKQDMEGVGDDF